MIRYTDAYGFDSAYDSASSCDPRTTRKARAHLISSIPCDLSQTGYCNEPGNLYPWHAVRRFVNENHGLMKRMYGDLRHKSVLKTEMDNNGIDDYDIERAAKRYSRKNKFLRQDYQMTRNNDVISEPHFRPTSTTTAAPPSTTSTSSTTTTTKSTESTTKVMSTNMSSLIFQNPDNEQNYKKKIIEDSLESNSVLLNFTSTIEKDNIEIIQAPNLSPTNANESAIISTTLKKIQIPFVEDSTEKTESIATQVSSTTEEITIEELFEFGTNSDDIITAPSILESTEFEEILTTDESQTTKDDNNKLIETKETLKQNKPSTLAANMEGQLFQDVVQKDTSSFQTQNFRGKGINACPVKEEVVAPFWANNTRGEVLALLNLYPFEQYVHWEKCTHEDKQMYCRDGCRCEQQYSLHRLLAYDPNNDCRGIFSDWFRFPSCCVCKCYNIPGIEYRGTSRSPRSEGSVKHPADLAEEELRRAIYEHATEEWYRPKDEFNNF